MRRMMCAVLALLAAGCGDDDGGGEPDGGGGDAGMRDGGGGACTGMADCDDGIHCNGQELCDEGACLAGTPVDCDDGDACTTDACDEVSRSCTHDGSDADGDGHVAEGCDDGDDCDDTNMAIHPGADEVCDIVDDDCNPATFGGTDEDADSYVSSACCNGGTCGIDCDDTAMSVHPDATEACNDVDDDCDGMIDDGATVTLYPDTDGDLHGALAGGSEQCPDTPGYVPSSDDCDDTDNTSYPGATEVCDTRDNDCDGTPDDGVMGDACSAGVGACERDGLEDCDGTCSAMPGAPVTDYQRTIAPNGSWDWDCDGADEGESTIAVPGSALPTIATCCGAVSMSDCISQTRMLCRPAATTAPDPYCGVDAIVVTTAAGTAPCVWDPTMIACLNRPAAISSTTRVGCR